MLIWIAHARAVQDEAPGDGRVRYAGSMIAGALARLARGCWPGTVSALRVDTPARDAYSALRPRDPLASKATWRDVTTAASASLADLETSESARGADDDGWFDAARTRPGPADPDQVLAAVASMMASRFGVLGEKPSWDKRPSEEELLKWARELRWIRRDVSDPVTWGLLAGRIRHWLDRDGDRFTSVAGEFSPEYVPPRPWAAVLGFAIGAHTVIDRNRETDVRAALSSPPDETAPDDTIRSWLATTLPSWDTHAAEIVAAVKPIEARVLVIPTDAFEAHGRRVRRCLGKLKVALTTRDAKLPAPPPRQETPSVTVDEAGDVLAQMPRELRERVVVRTRGLRALFVGNRRDPELLVALERVFEFSTLECSEAEPRRVDAVVASIESHRYDVVLGATGFLDHTVDRKIARAARGAEIRYVRVHRGRPQASLLAVAREYGVAGDRGEWRLFDDPS